MLIYGINAVAEALKAGRVVSMRAGRRTISGCSSCWSWQSRRACRFAACPMRSSIANRAASSHQGVIADVSERRVYELHDLIEDAHAHHRR